VDLSFTVSKPITAIESQTETETGITTSETSVATTGTTSPSKFDDQKSSSTDELVMVQVEPDSGLDEVADGPRMIRSLSVVAPQLSSRDFLSLVYKDMRFGHMSPKCFISEVVSEKVLTDLEVKCVLIHLHCREYTCGPFNIMKRKAEMSAKKIIITRGDFEGPWWSYNGSKDAIAIKVDKDVSLDVCVDLFFYVW